MLAVDKHVVIAQNFFSSPISRTNFLFNEFRVHRRNKAISNRITSSLRSAIPINDVNR